MKTGTVKTVAAVAFSDFFRDLVLYEQQLHDKARERY
jgi:hypothetical protein